MFEQSRMMYIYVETPLHAGSGRAVGVVDLPIQRERSTNYPLVQASGVKGRLRAEVVGAARDAVVEALRKDKPNLSGKVYDDELDKRLAADPAYNMGLAIFGPETTNADAYAGALSVGDARILLFPVRSVQGVFAYATSANVLARYVRDLVAANLPLPFSVGTLSVAGGSALVVSEDSKLGSPMVLEEFSFAAQANQMVDTIAAHLVRYALPGGKENDDYSGEFGYWRNSLAGRLVVLTEEDFRDFVSYSTEVVTRVKLDNDKKTVVNRMLWTEESLPTDTLLYAPLYMGKERKDAATRNKENGGSDREAHSADTLMTELSGKLDGKRVRLGGDETTGRGSVALRFGAVAASKQEANNGG